MKTYYEEKDLVSFGLYLLSKRRKKYLKQSTFEWLHPVPYKLRRMDVYDADIENWKEENR